MKTERNYGFYTEEYEDCGYQIKTLGTGDGKTQFTDERFEDGRVGIGMSYGHEGTIGDEITHPKGKKANEIGVEFQITFLTQESIDSLIKAALRAKNNLQIQES